MEYYCMSEEQNKTLEEPCQYRRSSPEGVKCNNKKSETSFCTIASKSTKRINLENI